MSREEFRITGVGMVASLGRDVQTACAASRAGLLRTTELICMNSREYSEFGKETPVGFAPIAGHLSPGFDGFSGKAKLLQLGTAALRDLSRNRPLAPEEPARTGIHLNLSDWFLERVHESVTGEPPRDGGEAAIPVLPRDRVEDTADLVSAILERCDIVIPPENQALYNGGHAGIVVAILNALDKIRRGALDRCIVGGVDSCVEPRFLHAAAALKVLKTGDNPTGFLPGEAAGFFLIERVDAKLADALEPRITIRRTALAGEARHRFSRNPSPPMALELVIRHAMGQDRVTDQEPSLVIGDLNGNEDLAMEWGYALVRLRGERRYHEVPMWIPAASFGETGAAAGALSVCMAAEGYRRGYIPGSDTLVWLASDDGARGAFVLSRT